MGDGLVDPEAFPARPADLDVTTINDAADVLRRMGKGTREHVRLVEDAWSGLRAHYQAPEQDQVHGLLRPAGELAQDVKDQLLACAGHLDAYAARLNEILPDLRDLERRALEFRARVAGGVTVDASEAADAGILDHAGAALSLLPGVEESQVTVPWYEDTATCEENRRLVGEYNAMTERISAAAADCANVIYGVGEGRCGTVVEPVTARAIETSGLEMPWGHPTEEDRNCVEATGAATMTAGTALTTLTGQAVLGHHPESGELFTADGYGTFWRGAVDLTTSITVAFGRSLVPFGREGEENRWTAAAATGVGRLTPLTPLGGLGLLATLNGVADHRADRTETTDISAVAEIAGAYEPAKVPGGPGDLYGGLQDVYDIDGAVRVQTMTRSDGSEVAVVQVPGTQTWDPLPGEDPYGPYGAVASASGKDSPQRTAVLEAMKQAGIAPDTPVVLVGHSQGGFTVMDVAADPAVTVEYTIDSVVTAGAGGGQFDLPDGVTHVSLRNPYDPVARIGGAPDDAITVSGTWEGLDTHSSKNYHELLTDTDDPRVKAWWDSLDVDEVTRIEDKVYQASVG